MRTFLLVVMVLTAGRSAFAADDAPIVVNMVPVEQPVAAVELKTEAPRPITSRWYFWVSIGGAVVATAATALAVGAAMNRQTPPTLTANQVCGAGGCSGTLR